MKTLVIIAVLIAVTVSERCDHDDDCTDTACVDQTHTVRCSHDRCTCVSKCSKDDSCDDREECEHDAVKLGCNCDQGMHCIDKRCHCGYPGISTLIPVATSPMTSPAPTTETPQPSAVPTDNTASTGI